MWNRLQGQVSYSISILNQNYRGAWLSCDPCRNSKSVTRALFEPHVMAQVRPIKYFSSKFFGKWRSKLCIHASITVWCTFYQYF